jgi:hypothetical protein
MAAEMPRHNFIKCRLSVAVVCQRVKYEGNDMRGSDKENNQSKRAGSEDGKREGRLDGCDVHG